MAKNYGALREALQAAEDPALQRLSHIFQPHRSWLQQASDELKSQVAEANKKQPQKAGRGRTADKVRGQQDSNHVHEEYQLHKTNMACFKAPHLVLLLPGLYSIARTQGTQNNVEWPEVLNDRMFDNLCKTGECRRGEHCCASPKKMW